MGYPPTGLCLLLNSSSCLPSRLGNSYSRDIEYSGEKKAQDEESIKNLFQTGEAGEDHRRGQNSSFAVPVCVCWNACGHTSRKVWKDASQAETDFNIGQWVGVEVGMPVSNVTVLPVWCVMTSMDNFCIKKKFNNTKENKQSRFFLLNNSISYPVKHLILQWRWITLGLLRA